MIVKSKSIVGGSIPKVSVAPYFSERIMSLDFNSIIGKILQERADTVIPDMVTEQLNKGSDSDGKDLGVYKIFSYKNRFRPVDLKDTGDFHNSIKAIIKSDSIEIDATDQKRDLVQDKYGDAILGLSDENVQYLIDDIREEFVSEVRKEFFK